MNDIEKIILPIIIPLPTRITYGLGIIKQLAE